MMQRDSNLWESIAVLTSRRFGRKTENCPGCWGRCPLHSMHPKLSKAEVLTNEGIPEEPEIEKVIIRADRPEDYIGDLVPWSDKLLGSCRK